MPKRDETYMEARRGEILAAAKRAALDKGFAHVTMRDIAEEAGVSLGAITTHFQSRDDIVAYAAAEAGRARARALEDGVDAGTLAKLFAGAEAAREIALDLQLILETGRSETREAIAQIAARQTIRQLCRTGGDEESLTKDQARLILTIYFGLGAMGLVDETPSADAVQAALSAIMKSS